MPGLVGGSSGTGSELLVSAMRRGGAAVSAPEEAEQAERPRHARSCRRAPRVRPAHAERGQRRHQRDRTRSRSAPCCCPRRRPCHRRRRRVAPCGGRGAALFGVDHVLGRRLLGDRRCEGRAARSRPGRSTGRSRRCRFWITFHSSSPACTGLRAMKRKVSYWSPPIRPPDQRTTRSGRPRAAAGRPSGLLLDEQGVDVGRDLKRDRHDFGVTLVRHRERVDLLLSGARLVGWTTAWPARGGRGPQEWRPRWPGARRSARSRADVRCGARDSSACSSMPLVEWPR